MSNELPESIFTEDNGFLVPTDLAYGPWFHGTQHGSSMLGLAAWGAERHPSDVPRQVTRLTVDMMKALPIGPVEVKTTTHREGRYIDIVDISLRVDGEEYVRASALRYRLDEIPVTEEYLASDLPVFPEKPQPSIFQGMNMTKGFHLALDFRLDMKKGEVPIMWLRLKKNLVEGYPITPLQRVAVAADWTYSVPNIAISFVNGKGFTERKFHGINPDTTINLHQPPEGEWIGLKSTISYGNIGAGTVGAQLFDQHQAIGFSSQSVLIRGANSAPKAQD